MMYGSLIPKAGNDLVTSVGANRIGSDFLSAIPMAVAAPVLAYQQTKAQERVLISVIEAKQEERKEILKTMRELASNGELTSERFQLLMVAYSERPY